MNATDVFSTWDPEAWRYCGENCAYRKVPPHATVCDHNGKKAVVADGIVWLPFTTAGHPAGHPLHRSDRLSIPERPKLLASVVTAPIEGVTRVLASCNCAYSSPLARGLSLVPPAVVPSWVRRFVQPSTKAEPRLNDWPKYARAISCLASGLRAMHTRGIAHGDAFLFNAVWTEGDQAYWVDLGAIARTDEVATASDVFTFWQFGVLGSLPATNAPREAMEYLAELASLPETERLAGLTRLPSFKGRAEPVTAEEPLQLAVTSLSRTPSHHAVAARALSIYYRAFRWNEAAAIRLDQQRALEQARHVIAEREMQRVLRLENNREVDRLQQQLGTIDAERIRRQEYIRQLELKVEELSAENVARGRYLGTLESRVEALAGIDSKRREYLAELEARIQALSEQDTERKKYLAGMERSLHDARQLANDRAEYIARLERNLAAVSDNNEKRGAYIEKLQKQLGERA